jgi:hypothetical protein
MFEILCSHVAEIHLQELYRWVASRKKFAESHASSMVTPWGLGEVMCIVVTVTLFVVITWEGEFDIKVREAQVDQVWGV